MFQVSFVYYCFWNLHSTFVNLGYWLSCCFKVPFHCSSKTCTFTQYFGVIIMLLVTLQMTLNIFIILLLQICGKWSGPQLGEKSSDFNLRLFFSPSESFLRILTLSPLLQSILDFSWFQKSSLELIQTTAERVWVLVFITLIIPLQVTPSTKLSLHYLRKMSVYVRTRDGCFPVLCWPMWKHIACGKLQLPEYLAWLYFEMFDLVIGQSPEERLERADCLSQCSSKSELDQQRNKVKTRKFTHVDGSVY